MSGIFQYIPILKDYFENKALRPGIGDFVDRLHSQFTVGLLAVFALMVGSKQYFGSPMDCVLSLEANVKMVNFWGDYFLDYCYIHGNDRYASSVGATTSLKSGDYYQYVPMFFVFQIACFMTPELFWNTIQSMLYFDLKAILAVAVNIPTDPSSNEYASMTVSHMMEYFNFKRQVKRKWLAKLIHYPTAVTYLYTSSKLFSLFNAILQLLLLTAFLGFPADWGIDIITDLVTLRDRSYEINGTTLPYFPLNVLCETDYGVIGSKQSHTVRFQCLLTMNWINEKIFVALWVWLVLLICISAVHLGAFLLHLCSGVKQSEMVMTIMQDKANVMESQQHYVETFVHKFVGLDGVLLIRSMEELTDGGELVTQYLLLQCWQEYLSNPAYHEYDLNDVDLKSVQPSYAPLHNLAVGKKSV